MTYLELKCAAGYSIVCSLKNDDWLNPITRDGTFKQQQDSINKLKYGKH